MKKMNVRKSMMIMLAMVMLLSVIPVGSVSAASKPTCKKKYTIWWSPRPAAKSCQTIAFGKNDRVSSIKSSNSKVIKVSKKGNFAFIAYGKKTGTATVTMKVKRGKKTYTVKTKVTSVKLDPFKSIKIGNMNMKKIVQETTWWHPNDKTASGAFTYKLNKGWSTVSLKVDGDKVKSGSKVTVKEGTEIELTVKHNKTGKTHTIEFDNTLW